MTISIAALSLSLSYYKKTESTFTLPLNLKNKSLKFCLKGKVYS